MKAPEHYEPSITEADLRSRDVFFISHERVTRRGPWSWFGTLDGPPPKQPRVITVKTLGPECYGVCGCGVIERAPLLYVPLDYSAPAVPWCRGCISQGKHRHG